MIKTAFRIALFLCTLACNVSQAQDTYVGSSTCQTCHAKEYQQWQGSHHDWAMREASAETVLGDFNNVSFHHQGLTTSFSSRDGKYYVRTQGADGKDQTFKIAYTFGVEPLQQYLIGFPDGRYQALTVAWDSRTAEQGGQRWYQLMPNDMGQPGESLHWTGVYYNWNTQCAACHSTGLQENYFQQNNSYNSTWAEINVSCESCHGPGSAHSNSPQTPLPVDYSPQLQWVIAEGADIANPLGDPHAGSKIEIESCAGCHSRRAKISADSVNNHQPGSELLDHYRPQTLREGLYHADGQIQDEVYVYGSFIQSKMHQRGVRCSNCHEPHSLELKAPGNGVCANCHAPETYNSPKHHFHQPANSPGAQCVNCHMPSTVYMGVDPRRDHSMRIPDPQLAEKTGAPNACINCHQNKTNAWAGSAISSWLKLKSDSNPQQSSHYGEAIFAGREQQQGANQQLIDLATDSSINSIARATALGLLQNHPNQGSYQTARQQLSNKDPMVRLGALETLEFLQPQQRWEDISPLLTDPIKAVRLEATRLLLGLYGSLPGANIDEYMDALLLHADRPNGQLNIASAYMEQGLYKQAGKAYQHALKLDPLNTAAINNYADSLRAQGQHQQALELLIEGNKSLPNNAALLHALGLAQIRSQQPALESLRRAAQLEPKNSRYSYIYALGVNGQGDAEQAVDILSRALINNPKDRDLLIALVTINRDRGELSQARVFARQLVATFPNDSSVKRLLESL